MSGYNVNIDEHMELLKVLSEKYPSMQSVCTEIINLKAILNLPKGTEHFMSDLHGEYESFFHILNNCSGVVKEKVKLLFAGTHSKQEQNELCTLIYYPEQKLERIRREGINTPEWYRFTLQCLINLAKLLSSKYTRSKVRKAMPQAFSYILDELLHAQPDEDNNQHLYHDKIIDTLIELNNGDDFIVALATLIKRLAVDHLHIVGDMFDRGPRPDTILDLLMQYHSLDIEWGNHDILWMGAAAGSEACIAAVVRNSLTYYNTDVLERGYGISLRSLVVFAEKAYPEICDPIEAAAHAVSIIMFKLEGQIINRNPDFNMEDRLFLDKIDAGSGTVCVNGRLCHLSSRLFNTVDSKEPYRLTADEAKVMSDLRLAFMESGRLNRHIKFLYSEGSIYKCFNDNLMFHGCIPLDESGDFRSIQLDGHIYKGKSYLNYADNMARRAYMNKNDIQASDFMWYLWCGCLSPVSGRTVKTFERMFVVEQDTWEEPQDAYYTHCNDEKTCNMILREFGIFSDNSHIINGHTPVRVIKGESPIKANGRLIVIDGGFCKAYQKKTGIAGYTLIYNSHGMRIMSHQPFVSMEKSLEDNADIKSRSCHVETERKRVLVKDTDTGKQIKRQIIQLEQLHEAYKQGILIPKSDNIVSAYRFMKN